MTKRFSVAIDGNNILAMNTHTQLALRSPTTGKPTGGLYGTVRKIRSVILEALHGNVDSVYFVIDAGRPDFRTDLCPTYKTGRKEAREKTKDGDEFYKAYKYQMKEIPRLLLPLGIHVVRSPGYEADDCIAGLAVHHPHTRWVIVSGDKDLLQLHGNRKGRTVRVYKPSQHDFAEHPGKGYLLRRCLEGDSSDNIPGVGGIGPKKSQEIIDFLRDKKWPLTPKSIIRCVEEFGLDFPSHKILSGGKRKDMDKEKQAKLRANWRVMRLAYTAEPAYKLMEEDDASFRPKKFFRVCRELGFNSLLEDPDVFIQPFKDMHKGAIRAQKQSS